MTDDSIPLAKTTDFSALALPPEPAKKKRGFAAMNAEQVREFARRGGVAAHRAGTAHEFTSDEARTAGRKGGLAAHSPPRQDAAASGDSKTEDARP